MRKRQRTEESGMIYVLYVQVFQLFAALLM